MGKKLARWARPRIKNTSLGIQASDESVLGDAVRGLCPCHAGWEVFEENVSVVLRHLRGGSRSVKAQALHVYEDAARMQGTEDLKYYVESGEERIGEKRACARYRSMQERLEARRERKIKKQKRRHRVKINALWQGQERIK